jgi:flagellar hook-basal body complex protein FliE
MNIESLLPIGKAEAGVVKQMQEIQAKASLAPGAEVSGIGPGGALRAEFASHLNKAVSEVEGKMRAAEAEKLKVLTGEANNLHQATIAASEAGIAFSLMIEVRNKLVESYQELMRMQV